MRKETLAILNKVRACSVFLLFYFFLLSFITFCVSTGSANQDQIDIIESNLTRERQKYEKFDLREKDLLSQVAELEHEVSGKRSDIAALEKKIRQDKGEIKKLEKKHTSLEKVLHDTEIKAGKRFVALYKYAKNGYFNTLTDVLELDQLWQRVKYLRAVSEQDLNELTIMAEECLKYKRSISQVTEKIAKKEKTKKKENAQLGALREDLEENVIRLMRIHKEKEFYETAVNELQLAALDLKQTFSKIEKKEQYQTTWFSHFADAKHKLPFPLKGKLIRGDKLLGSKNLNFCHGIFIDGSDPEVRAVFAGRVDFSGQLKGYGEMVIINHGSRYFTISAQLSKRIKEEGEQVKSGEVIGLVGRNGSLKKVRVYFEIRKSGKSLDPLVWLKKS